MVEPVRAAEGFGSLQLVAVQAFLLRHGLVRPAGIEAAFGQLEIPRNANVDAAEINVGGNGRVHVLRQCLESYPAAAEAGHGPAIQAHVQNVLDTRRVQYRHAGIQKSVITLMGQGG